MPRSRIRSFQITDLTAELNQPFRISSGQHDELKNLLITITLDDGTTGLGEAAVANHITGETLAQARRNLWKAGELCVGRPVGTAQWISSNLHCRFAQNPAVIGAVDTALLDARTRHDRIPLWRYFGKTARALQSDVTIVLADLEETRDSINRFYRQGFRMFKVKIGRDLDRDIKRILLFKDLAPGCPVIVDANQGYTPAEMVRFVDQLKRRQARLDLIEQPVPREDWQGLQEIERKTRIPVCADESARTLKDVHKIIKYKLCSAVNIKIMKCGLFHGQRIARLCQDQGIRLMIGGMMESGIAMTASAHLAAGMGGFTYIDLDTPFFIKGAVERHPYLSPSGRYTLGAVPAGIGLNRDQLYDG